ncbi:PKD-like domain-containing protein, partial [Bacteroidota bacterium]
MQKLYFLLFFVLFLTFQGFSEGSKELWIANHETNLYFCSNFTSQCNNGNGDRTQFAIYGCDPPDRLYIATASNNETIYFGLRATDVGNNNHIVYRIKNLAGNIVKPEANVPGSGAGFIVNINEARVGPEQVYGAGGYNALSFHPPTPGIYYIEFDRVSNSTGNPNPGSFTMRYFDFTVTDTVSNVVKPGRVFSKAWQFQESGGDNCSATFYIFSNDSIITSLALNNMSGGVWVTFCNQYGCANTGNFIQDRKSLSNQQAFVPQYNIFLNTPDPIIFPPATTLGQIIPPVTGERFCDNGHILFQVNVDKGGNVVIELDFDPPYTTRTLGTAVNAGINPIEWDGLDGNGVPVPNNININLTISYINGLTNLPLYDVESNNNGFTIGLVSPAGTTPLVYWDDSNISGGTQNFTGCLSPPGCHPWPDGDHHTINTWWYNVATTTTPPSIEQFRRPQLLVFNQSPPQSYCAGTNSVTFSVATDPNSDTLHWNYTGLGATIIDTDPTDAFIMVNFSGSATSGNLEVYGTNENCANPGPTATLPITIKPRPVVDPPFAKSICSGSSTNLPLTSTPVGAGFSWNSLPPTCTPNIVTCPLGNSGSTINNILNISDLNTGTVTYHVLPTLNGCNGTTQNIIVSVDPLPDVLISSTTPSLCSGETTNIQFTSTVPSTVFNWTATASSPDVSGYSLTGVGDIAETISNSGFTTETVTYSILPTVNGCTPTSPTDYVVTIFPIPDAIITSTTPTICSGETTDVLLTSSVSGTTLNWTAVASSLNLSGFSASGSGDILETITNSGFTTETVTYTILPTANGCSPASPSTYVVTVYPIPDLVVTSTTPSLCSGEITDILLTSSVGGTTFQWTATATSPDVSGYTDGTGDQIAQVLSNTAPTIEIATYHITPVADGCSPGTPIDYPITIYPLPDVLIDPITPGICSGQTTNILLSSSVAGTTLNWTAVGSSPNLSGYALSGSGDILETITNSGFTKETVTYTIMPVANGCSPVTPTVYVLTVSTIPDLIINSSTPSICSGETTDILLSSSVLGTTFSWTTLPSSPDLSGYADGSGDLIDQTILNSGFTTETVTYTITPDASGCSPASPTDCPVTIFPIPDAMVNNSTPTVCSGLTTNIQLSSSVSGATVNWIASASSANVSGYSDGNGTLIGHTLINAGYTIDTVTYRIYASGSGCTGDTIEATVVVFP